MTEQDINIICWWIPFKKTRNAVRGILTSFYLENHVLHNNFDVLKDYSNDLKNDISLLKNQIKSDSENNRYQRVLEKIQEDGLVVRYGVFQGMNYLEKGHWGAYLPRLLGSYESQLSPWINEIKDKNYDLILDIGCAEGYYAVGFAYLGLAKEIVAYDISSESIGLAKKLKSINNLKSKLDILNKFCTHDEISEISKSKKTLIFCDIEGAEYDLLDPEKCEALKNIDIIFEDHEHLFNDKEHKLKNIINKFSFTHTVDIVLNIEKNPDDYPFLHKFYPEIQKQILNEERASRSLTGIRQSFVRMTVTDSI